MLLRACWMVLAMTLGLASSSALAQPAASPSRHSLYRLPDDPFGESITLHVAAVSTSVGGTILVASGIALFEGAGPTACHFPLTCNEAASGGIALAVIGGLVVLMGIGVGIRASVVHATARASVAASLEPSAWLDATSAGIGALGRF